MLLQLRRPTRLISRHLVRHSSTASPQRSIAIAGAGIAGLTAALELSRALPSHRIVLLESSQRLGGWVHSERITLTASDGSGKSETALLEGGPRSIRPVGAPGLAMLSLVSPPGSALKLCTNASLHRSSRSIYKISFSSSPKQPHQPRIASCTTRTDSNNSPRRSSRSHALSSCPRCAA